MDASIPISLCIDWLENRNPKLVFSYLWCQRRDILPLAVEKDQNSLGLLDLLRRYRHRKELDQV